MKHYHVMFLNEYDRVISRLRYDNIDDAVIFFMDMCYSIYPYEMNPEFRSEHIQHVYALLNEEDDQVVVKPSKKFSIGVLRCPYESCVEATYN